MIIRDGLAFPNYFFNFDFEAGRPLDPQAADCAAAMLDRLPWWATALRKARAETPYPSIS